MVKVLKCHNFRSQTIVPVQDEPHLLSSGKDVVFIATCDSTIEVYKPRLLDKQWEKFCSFQTGASITQLLYNQAVDYVATIECKTSRRSEVVSVKVYLNWTIAHTLPEYRTRVRVASLGYRSNKVETDSRLEVIDIPCPKPARTIATCQQTGNLAIAFENTVQLFHPVEKIIPNSQTTYLDIVIFLELKFDYQVYKVDLCEEYFTSASKDLAQVFKMVYSDDVRRSCSVIGSSRDSTPIKKETPSGYSRRVSSTILSSISQQNIKLSRRTESVTAADSYRFSNIGENSSTTPSPSLSLQSKSSTEIIEDDADFVRWTFSDQTSVPATGTTSSREVNTSATVKLAGLQYLINKAEINGSPPTVKDLRGGSHATTGQISVTTLLTRRLDTSDHSWLKLQLIPSYLHKPDRSKQGSISENVVPVHSAHHFNLIGVCCLMSGPLSGFMYSLMPGTKCLSTYRFTQEAKQVCSDGSMVHVVKKGGIETYSARCHIAATHNSQSFNNVTKSCPSADTDVCLVSMHQFLGPRQITLTDHHVILLLKMPDSVSENIWNIYALEKPSPSELYRDLIAFGSKCQQSSSETYHHLLLEGHMTLKSSLIGQSSPQSDQTVVKDQLLESCALLGDYYATPSCPDWHLCLPYYVMSGLSPADVVRQALQYKQHNKRSTPYSYGQGLMQYLSYVLFQDEDPLDLKQSDCDLILDVCAETMADNLADIVLFSRLRTFSPEKALEHVRQAVKQWPFNSNSKIKAKGLLAAAALNLDLCEPELALASLSAVDKHDLEEICVSHHQVLHTDLIELSPLSQLMRCHCPDVLNQVLVTLYDHSVVPLDLAIKLLQGKSGVPEIHRNSHVMLYLEKLVNDASRRFVFDEAVTLLCEIYVKRITEWEPPTCRELATSMKFRLPKGKGHFGRRHKWLDFLPPFSGSQSINEPCKHVVLKAGRKAASQGAQLLQCQKNDVVCSCFLCNEELLKLQSLLCSSFCKPQLAESVISQLSDVNRKGYFDSVQVLCMIQSNTTDSLKLIVEKYPNTVAMFAMATLGKKTPEWEELISLLLNKIQSDNKDDSKEVYLTSLKDVLTEMSGQFSPETFLQIIPGKGNFFFFLPYFQMCLDKHQTSLLRQKILIKGDSLAQSL